MEIDIATIAAISFLFGIALIGFFWTKTAGFGKYSTAALLLILVLFITSTAFFRGMIEAAHFTNLLAAVAGFAGGLFSSRES